VSNGEQALDAVQAKAALQDSGRATAFDLVSMDFHMPVMDGCQSAGCAASGLISSSTNRPVAERVRPGRHQQACPGASTKLFLSSAG